MTANRIDSYRPLVIEFVGCPGSGKSSLLSVVSDVCRSASLAPMTVVESARPLASRTVLGRLVAVLPEGRIRSRGSWLVFRWASTAISVPQVVRTWPLPWRVLRSQLGRKAGAEAGRRRVVYWLYRLLGAHALFLRRARAEEVLLLDEGYVHRVVQLFASEVEEPDPVAVDSYLATVPVPDLTVVVHAPIERCVERVVARGVWSRFDGRGANEVTQFIASAHRAAELAAGHARRRGWNLVEVDNGMDGLEASRAALRSALTEWLGLGVGDAR